MILIYVSIYIYIYTHGFSMMFGFCVFVKTPGVNIQKPTMDVWSNLDLQVEGSVVKVDGGPTPKR